MEIVKQRSGETVDLRVSGRLDNHWSVAFDEALMETIREGGHHLRLDLSDVNYLSSAGIGVLVKAHREAGRLQGSLVIGAASARVLSVLQLVKLETILFSSGPAQPAATDETVLLPRTIESETALFESYALGSARAEYRLVGEPATLKQGAYREATAIQAARDVFALGLGALGHGFEECRGHFGEFVVAGGSAAFLPTDGTATPDYAMITGEMVPEVQALYGIVFRGAPAHLLRFERSTPLTAVPLSEILRVCAEIAKSETFGVVMSAEVAGLVCTVLRRPPVEADAARFEFPAVRNWLSFASEREHARTSGVVVGLVTTNPSAALAPFVRPVSARLSGHLHAAVTTMRSLPRGKLQIGDVLKQAFQPRSVFSVVHLLRDDREIEGAGESEFQRGACWVFPMPAGVAQ